MPLIFPPLESDPTSIPVAGVPFTLDYYPTVNGDAYDPANNGGSVDTLDIYSDSSRTTLVSTVGPAAKVSDGRYRFSVGALSAGIYYGTVTYTPTGTSGSVTDANSSFVVYPFDGAFAVALCTVDEVKQQMNKDLARTTDDAELQQYIDALPGDLRAEYGVFLPEVIEDEEHPGWVDGIVLHERPVSITSVTEYAGSSATLLDAELYRLDSSDILRRQDTSANPMRFGGPVAVTYVAGLASIPAEVNLAARFIVQGRWTTQRSLAKGDEPFAGRALVDEGLNMLKRWRRGPTVA